MKKIFLSMLAVAGMMFVNSCSQDEIVNEPINDGFVNATFTIGATDGMGTRGDIGKGLQADKVACAVYDVNGTEMAELRQYVDVIDGDPRTAKYTVRLAKGQDYRVVFFAYTSNGTGMSDYYDLRDLTNIKINTAKSNIEDRDAFTNYVNIKAEDLTNKNSIAETVTLYRPFAQLNLGINNAEFEAARKAGIVVKNTKIVVSNVYTQFNAYENKAVENSINSVAFDYNVIPTEQLEVNGDQYTYLALNYLLVGDLGTEKTLTDVEFSWQTETGKTNLPTTTFVNIPVQRNYRTNIIGRLLTTPSEFDIIIDADFDGEKLKDIDVIATVNVTSAAELQAALDNAAAGGQTTIIFDNDIDGDVTITQKANVDILINGNDKKFTGVMTTFGNGRQAGLESLTIKNINFVAKAGAESCIVSPDRSVNNLYSYAHNVTVYNCTFTDPDGVVNCAAVRHQDGGDEYWTIRKCTVDNTIHSLVQVNNVNHNLTIDQCIVKSKNGANLNCCTNVNINNCEFDVRGYAVRFGVATGGNYGEEKTFSIVNSTLESSLEDLNDAVIMFRASAVDATLTLVNTTVNGDTKVKGNTAETTIVGLN